MMGLSVAQSVSDPFITHGNDDCGDYVSSTRAKRRTASRSCS